MHLKGISTAIFFSISAFSMAYGQERSNADVSESAARLGFADAAITRMSNDIAKQSNEEKRELEQRAVELKQAIKTGEENAKARRLERSRAAATLGTIHKSGGAASAGIDDIDREIGVFERSDALRAQQENEENVKVMRLEREKQEAKLKVALREKGKAEIAALQVKLNLFRLTPTEAAWDDLSEQITIVSAQQGSGATLVVATKSAGAFIRYQTKGERRRNKTPHPAAHPTNNCEESVPFGEYFIWSEREGKPTSDQNKPYDVFTEKKSIELEELPQ